MEPNKQQEFAQARGETVRSGSKDVLGGVSLPEGITPGIAPPDPLNVVSAFDTRPIGAFDASFTDVNFIGNGETAVVLVEFSLPQGYTFALRGVHVEFTPNGFVNIISQGGVSLDLRIMRNGGPIPNALWTLRGALGVHDWPTHQVYGHYETMGLRIERQGLLAVPLNALDTLDCSVTMRGVLIPTKSRDPSIEIASAPVLVSAAPGASL